MNILAIENSRYPGGSARVQLAGTRRTTVAIAMAMAMSLCWVSLACYNPSITDVGLICAEAGKACPDGFICSPTDGRCHAVITCSVPRVTPLCQEVARPGAVCNPTCQIGCACGRCNVVGASSVCSTSVGTVKLGQICTAGPRDNCEPGLICLLESDTCGVGIGRCYQHCTTSAQCGTGRSCDVPILYGPSDTLYRTCGLMPQPCNPVANATNNGCPNPALTCYLNTDGSTFCDCPTSKTPVIAGGVCVNYSDCAANLVCASSTGSVGSHCRQACTVASPTCPSGQRCIAEGSTYGYCG